MVSVSSGGLVVDGTGRGRDCEPPSVQPPGSLSVKLQALVYDIFPSFGGRCQTESGARSMSQCMTALGARKAECTGHRNYIYIIMTADIRYIIYHFGTSVIQPTGEVSLPESPRGKKFGFKVSVDPAGTCLDCRSTLSLSLSLYI